MGRGVRVGERVDDAIVVGAGPAGLQAAKLLAQDGFQVTVLEEHEAVGTPTHCTGLVSAEVSDLYKVPDDIVLQKPAACLVTSPGGAEARFQSAGEELIVLDRRALDQDLAASALQAGAALLTGQRVRQIARTNGHVEALTGDGGRFCGRVLVVASGISYRFHPLMASRSPAVLQTAQVEVAARAGEALEIHLGRAIAPEGFAWAVPVQRGPHRRMKVGVLLRGDARAHLRRFLARPEIAGRLVETPGEPVRRPLPVAPVGRSYGERVLAVGDAAGLTKPVTGGGIFYSLLSASMGAEVLASALRHDDLSAGRLAEYEARWRARLMPELRAGAWFRWLVAKLSDRDLDRFVEAAAADDVREIVARTARFNWHRSVILAVLRQPGIKSILFRSLFR